MDSTSKVNWNSFVRHFHIRWCGLYFSWLAEQFYVSCLKQPFTSLIVDLPWYEQAYKLMADKLYYTDSVRKLIAISVLFMDLLYIQNNTHIVNQCHKMHVWNNNSDLSTQ